MKIPLTKYDIPPIKYDVPLPFNTWNSIGQHIKSCKNNLFIKGSLGKRQEHLL